jgi:hypothetical protein
MNIGDRIRVTVRHADDYFRAASPFRDTVYEGTVVRGNGWEPKETFNLLTGRPEYPVSVIAQKNVVACEVIGKTSGVLSVNGTKYIIVKGPKSKHRVSVFSSGLLDCDCVGFGFRRKCKHQAAALEWLKTKHGDNWARKVFV